MKQLKKGPIERYTSIILKHVYTYKILDFLFVYSNWFLKKCLWFSNVETYIYRYIPITTTFAVNNASFLLKNHKIIVHKLFVFKLFHRIGLQLVHVFELNHHFNHGHLWLWFNNGKILKIIWFVNNNFKTVLVKNSSPTWKHSRGFRIISNIWDGAFCKNN